MDECNNQLTLLPQVTNDIFPVCVTKIESIKEMDVCIIGNRIDKIHAEGPEKN